MKRNYLLLGVIILSAFAIISIYSINLPNGNNKYIITIPSYKMSINTNGFSVKGMVYTASVSETNDLYYSDINYKSEQNSPSNYQLKREMYADNVIQTEKLYNDYLANCNCPLDILDYYNGPEGKLFLVKANNQGFLLLADSNGEYTVKNVSLDTDSLMVKYLDDNNIPYDMFFQIYFEYAIGTYLTYITNTSVVIAHVTSDSLKPIITLNFSEYGNYTRTKINDGRIYIGFTNKIVVIESVLETESLKLANIISFNNRVIWDFAPFTNGVFFNSENQLMLYQSLTNKTIEITNTPFQLRNDLVAVNDHTIFFTNIFTDTSTYVSFTYNSTENESIMVFNEKTFEMTKTYSNNNNYYTGTRNNIEIKRLYGTDELFLLTHQKSLNQVTLYFNQLYTFPDNSPPQLTLQDEGVSLFVNVSGLGIVIGAAILIIGGLTKLQEKMDQDNVRNFIGNNVTNQKRSLKRYKKKSISICDSCGMKIYLNDFYCQKCGKKVQFESFASDNTVF